MNEDLVSTYKLAYQTGGKYQFESSIPSTVQKNRCITLENLYTTGNELDIDLSISYADNQLVRVSDIVPRLGDGFSIYATGYGSMSFGSDGGNSTQYIINPDFFWYDSNNSYEHDFVTNKYYLHGYLGDGFDNDDPDLYRARLHSVFFNFVSPFRYLISTGADTMTTINQQSACAQVLTVSLIVNSINGSNNFSNFPINVICRKIVNNYASNQDRSEIIGVLEMSYSTWDLSYPAEYFTLNESYNLNTEYPGYGVSIEIADLDYNPYNDLGIQLNDGTYVGELAINLTLSLQALYNNSTINNYNYNINLYIF